MGEKKKKRKEKKGHWSTNPEINNCNVEAKKSYMNTTQ